MNVTIRKIGNSEGVIILKDVLDTLGLKAGDNLAISTENGALKMQPVNEDLERQLKAARFIMDKYKVALKKLAE